MQKRVPAGAAQGFAGLWNEPSGSGNPNKRRTGRGTDADGASACWGKVRCVGKEGCKDTARFQVLVATAALGPPSLFRILVWTNRPTARPCRHDLNPGVPFKVSSQSRLHVAPLCKPPVVHAFRARFAQCHTAWEYTCIFQGELAGRVCRIPVFPVDIRLREKVPGNAPSWVWRTKYAMYTTRT